ncbi:putative MFS-type transporter YusP [Grifola frondosa]|uniref:Putative MFS-type transporter YusP n=1 Tax=Grifola frondosa TaxID=5627 RepID=A0A1C7LQV0_GRIFR|nr:putative MFS-type transporter YusP [Grifola frondosa]
MLAAYRYLAAKRKASKQNHAASVEEETKGSHVVGPGNDNPSQQNSNVQVTLATRPTSTTKRWKILLMLALVIPVFFETLDYTVVATAQVHIASVFNRLDLQSYIGTTYLLTSTVFLPVFASLADIWGRHWALQVSLFFFMIGSAISTGSQNMATMLVGRGIGGIGAAGLLAVVRIILADTRSLDENNWQQSMLFFLFTIGYCVGPVIGGCSNLDLLSLDFCYKPSLLRGCSGVGIFYSEGRTKGAQPRHDLPSVSPEHDQETFFDKLLRIDWVAALLFMAGGILVLLALNWGSTSGWGSTRVIVCFIVGGFIYLVFIAWEYLLERQSEEAIFKLSSPLFHAEPMVPLALFKSLDLCIVQFAIFVSGMVMLVMFYFVAIFMTVVTGLSSTLAGVQLIYFAPGLGVGSLMGITMLKFLRQPKYAIIAGGALMTVSLGLISMGMDHTKQSWINGFMAMCGVGVGLGIGSLVVHVRFSQPETRVAIVSALSLFFRSLGGTVGLAQCGAVLNAKVNSYITSLVNSGMLDPADAASLATGLATGITSIQGISALPPEVQSLVRDAFRDGSRWSFISLIPWSGVAFIGTLFLSNIRDTDREARERQAALPLSELRKSAEEIPKLESDGIVTTRRDS